MTRREPTTSVVVTCYNYGHYLAQCLDSVLTQAGADFEIIVIDDGSTDHTAEVMKGYAEVPAIRYVYQVNSGQARAKNHGIELARGRFVAFLDADDAWTPGKLEQQIPLFADDAVGVVYSRARFIDGQGRTLDIVPSAPYLKPRRGWVTQHLFMDNFVPFSSSIVPRRALEQSGGFDESLKMGIDWDLWLRLSTQYAFDFVDQPLLLYRMGHSGQMSKNAQERQKCADRIMRKFQQRFPGAVSAETVRKAAYYTACNRGYYYAKIDRRKSLRYYLDAVKIQPFKRTAPIGLLKLMVRSLPGGQRLRLTSK